MKVTVLVPWLVPKFAPEIATEVPAAPKFGVRVVMAGGGGAAVPVPVRETSTGAVLALFAAATVPVLVPVVVGIKDT